MKRSENDNKPGGFIAIDKPSDITSHDVVFKARKLFATSRVGHTGTLDPMATGVLVLLIGRAAKACEYISKDKKVYRATLRLGFETDTQDVTGAVVSEVVYTADNYTFPTLEEMKEICSRFVGRIVQIPPMYSALKVDGRKLCDLAREGKTVERQGREIEIYSIEVEPTDSPCDFSLTVACSGGTYIRTLCEDIGRAVGCGAVMATLRRNEASGIEIARAYTLEELGSMTEEQRWEKVTPTEELFTNYEKINLSAFYEKLYRDGCPIYLKKLGLQILCGTRLRVANERGEFFSLGDVIETPDGVAVKSIKIFNL